jgi:phage shock protein C
MQPRLTRHRTDRMIAGVCGGLGAYFGVDPVIVRLIFVVLAFTTFITPLIYPVLWLIMPEDPQFPPVNVPPGARYDPMTGQPLPPPVQPAANTQTATGGRNRTLGLLLAGIGAIALLNTVGGVLERVINVDLGGVMIPLLLVGAGVYLLRRKQV